MTGDGVIMRYPDTKHTRMAYTHTYMRTHTSHLTLATNQNKNNFIKIGMYIDFMNLLVGSTECHTIVEILTSITVT